MEYILCEFGVVCIILAPLFLLLAVGGFLFETALDHSPGFCRFVERLFDVDLSEEWDDE